MAGQLNVDVPNSTVEIGEPGASAPGCCAFHPGVNAPGSPENRSISRSRTIKTLKSIWNQAQLPEED